jgi:hypothetical protein
MRRSATTIGFLTLALLIFASTAHAQVSIGIVIGTPPPVPRVVRVAPPPPARAYVWVPGYWYPVKNRYRWREGYWALPPSPGAIWVGPRYVAGRYYVGYWDRDRGHGKHDRGRDKHRDRGRRR